MHWLWWQLVRGRLVGVGTSPLTGHARAGAHALLLTRPTGGRHGMLPVSPMSPQGPRGHVGLLARLRRAVFERALSACCSWTGYSCGSGSGHGRQGRGYASRCGRRACRRACRCGRQIGCTSGGCCRLLPIVGACPGRQRISRPPVSVQIFRQVFTCFVQLVFIQDNIKQLWGALQVTRYGIFNYWRTCQYFYQFL